MYNDVINLIKKYNRIIIHRHSKPDGDALGAQIGLKEIIKENFPQKTVYVVGDMTNRYVFMGEMDVIPDSFYSDALAIVCDCSEQFLINDTRYQKADKIIKIDHHLYREKFGDVDIVEEDYESCCGLIANIAFTNNLVVNSKAATALYTGMVTDSGRFRFDSTTPRTFNIAAKLLESNIDILDIYNNLYNDDLESVLLRAKFTLKMKLTAHNVAYIMTKKEELEEFPDVDFFTISRAMVNTMAGIKGVDIWANFTEDPNTSEVIVEIRSNKYNINPIAVKYGGGGHSKASGATLASFDVAEQLLNDLDKLVSE
ncbi:MAG: bifunctional oligoribonuclease/PAP phosphatase NrnA [Bacilli bacterium]|nr:bifunctional oligoribonuclease/PAP phosphatase NrnA [Bacilli bacterium]